MADISQIEIEGTTYNIKDTVARQNGGGDKPSDKMDVIGYIDYANFTIPIDKNRQTCKLSFNKNSLQNGDKIIISATTYSQQFYTKFTLENVTGANYTELRSVGQKPVTGKAFMPKNYFVPLWGNTSASSIVTNGLLIIELSDITDNVTIEFTPDNNKGQQTTPAHCAVIRNYKFTPRYCTPYSIASAMESKTIFCYDQSPLVSMLFTLCDGDVSFAAAYNQGHFYTGTLTEDTNLGNVISDTDAIYSNWDHTFNTNPATNMYSRITFV